MNQNTIFWNVDTQYDFMNSDGSLYVKGAEAIKPNLKRLTDYAAKNKLRVVNSADWHTKDSKEISDNPDYKTTFPMHCSINTKGAEFIPETNPENPFLIDWRQNSFAGYDSLLERRNLVLYKDDFDVFKGSPFTDRVLIELNPKEAVVYGVATNVCVNYAVLGLLERNVKVYVPTDAIKELPNLPLEEILNTWKQKGAILTTVDEIVSK